MPFRRRRTFRRSGSPGGRAKEWLQWNTFVDPNEPFCFNQPILLSAGVVSGAWIVDPVSMIDFFDEPTVMRNIIRWNITANMPAGTDFHVAQGIIGWKWPDNTSPVGSGGEPLPIENAAYDWLWYTEAWQHNSSATNTLIVTGGQGDKAGFEDIRSRRKMENGMGLLWMVQTDFCNTAVVRLNVGGRVLFLNR